MSSSATGKTAKGGEKDSTKRIHKFRYEATRDIFALCFNIVLAVILFIALRIVLNVLFYEYDEITAVLTGIYVVIVLIILSFNLLSIYKGKFKVMTIYPDEIVFEAGWLTKSSTSIPAHRIRSCMKSSTWLQRKCKTMDIGITTAGDNSEIYFENIRAGEKAYQLISKMAKENKMRQ